jgi:hypothetical protein
VKGLMDFDGKFDNIKNAKIEKIDDRLFIRNINSVYYT